MHETAPQTRSVVIERDIPFPAERIWRALTQPHLIAEWLMRNDFVPIIDHAFSFSTDWGAIQCRVLEVEPERSLTYTWEALGLESTVTWTLTPTPRGTLLRMEQAGFRPDQKQAYGGASAGWKDFLGRLEELLAGME